MASWDSKEVTNEHLLPYVDSKTAPPDVAAALNVLPFERNVFKLLANSTVSFKPFMALLNTMWSAERKIRFNEWQLCVLRIAATLDAPYEWDVNEPTARILGFDDAKIAAIKKVNEPLPEGLFTRRQRMVGRFIDELNRGNRVSRETMLAMKEDGLFGDEEIMELHYTHGVYSFLARMMNSCCIDLDPPIPGLTEMLKKFNAAGIERDLRMEEEDRKAGRI